MIELFTSQGCSSCPPADKLLSEYAQRPDVIALSFPVDYWDYLGWRDTLGTSKNTNRQREYAANRGDGMVYTPQLVVNGRVHCNGAAKKNVEKAMAETATVFQANRIRVSVEIVAGDVVIEAGRGGLATGDDRVAPGGLAAGAAGAAGKPRHATVWLATVKPHAEVEVRKGENKGHTLTYTNVVRDLTPVGMYQGEPMTIRLDKRAVLGTSGYTLAVIVQENSSGPILGAAMLPPPTN